MRTFDPEWVGRYSLHALDMFAYVDTMGMFMPHGGPDGTDRDFAALIEDNALSFIRSGRPADERWRTASRAKNGVKDCVALVGREMSFVARWRPDKCDFWLRSGFWEYSWQN